MQGCRYEMYKRLPRTLIPRTTMRYDRARMSLDRHAPYVVATFIAGASRQPSLLFWASARLVGAQPATARDRRL